MELFRETKDWPYAVSSGGLVYKKEGDTILVAILYRGEGFGPYSNSYHLPKGHLENNESLEAGALREIGEETGFEVVVEAYLGSLHSKFTHKRKLIEIDKTNHFFLCKFVVDSGIMDSEHESIHWIKPEDAISILSQGDKGEEEIIKRAIKFF